MTEHYLETDGEAQIQMEAVVGLKYRDGCAPVRLGEGAVVRAGTIIYADVSAGSHFQTGHHVVIRERTHMGDHVWIGTNSVLDGNVIIGNFVKIASNCYIPTHVEIGSRVFLGPNVTLTNDRYPLKMRDQYRPEGPTIEDGVTIGAGAVICPGIRISEGSFVAAGAVVTKDVPPLHLAKGVPARFEPLPEEMREINMALSWRKYLDE